MGPCLHFLNSVGNIMFAFNAVSELCVDSTQRETVCTVQIHHNLLPERYLFSFRSHLQVKHLLYHKLQCSVCG